MQKQNFLRTATLLIISAISYSIAAQTGPAGIGNKDGANGQPRNILWLDATAIDQANETEVPTWTDASGNSFNGTATNMPNFVTNVTNGNPVVRFTAANQDYMALNGAISTTTNGIASQNFTCFAVGSRPDASASYLIGGSGTPYFALGWYNNNTIRYNLNTSPIATTSTATNVFTLITAIYNRSNTNEQAFWLNGGTYDERNFDTPIIGYNAPTLGRNGGVNYNVDIAEVIFFQSALNSVQRSIVTNYLAAKYNLTITGDRFTSNPLNYWRDFRGIGQESDGKVVSGNSAGFSITDSTSLAAASYVMFAHNETANAVSTTDIPTTITSRWLRDWYVYKTGTISPKISFNFQEGISDGQFPQEVSNYRLLYRSGTSGAYSIVTTNPAILESVNTIAFEVPNTSLLNGYYTLGTIDDTNSPLVGKESVTYYTLISGNWNNPEVWTLDPSGMIPNNPGNNYPNLASDNVVIKSGKEVTMNINNATNHIVTVQGILNLNTTTGHHFDFIKGNGRIVMAADNFPSGDATHFMSADQGAGTAVFTGNSFTSAQPRTFYNVEVEMNTGQVLTTTGNLTVNHNLEIKSGTLQLNNSVATTSRLLTINNNLTVLTGGALSVGNGNAIHRILVYGDIENHGSIDLANSVQYAAPTNGAATLCFLGATNNTFSIDGNTELYRLVASKGTDKTYSIALHSNNSNWLKLMGPVSGADAIEAIDGAAAWQQLPLVIQNGTLQVGNNITINKLCGNRTGNAPNDFFIPSSAMLWIDGANLTTSLAGETSNGVTINGTLKVSAGSLTIPEGTNGITYTNNSQYIGSLQITGGTISSPQFKQQDNTSIGNFFQSGGEFKINSLAAVRSNNAAFSMPGATSSFSMSGGQISIETVNTYTTNGIQIGIQEGNYNVDGGTIQINTPTFDAASDSLFKISSTIPFYNLRVAPSGNSGVQKVSILSNLTLLNDLTIGSGTTFKILNLTLSVGGDILLQNNGTFITYIKKTDDTPTINSTLRFFGSQNSTITIEDNTNTSPLVLSNIVVEKDIHPTYGQRYNVSIAECTGRTTIANTRLLTDVNTIMTVHGTWTLTRGDFIIDRYSVNVNNLITLTDGSFINNIAPGRLVLFLDGYQDDNLQASSAYNTSFGRVELFGRNQGASSALNYRLISDANIEQLILELQATLFIGDNRLTIGAGGIVSTYPFKPQRMIVTTNTADAKGLRMLVTLSGNYNDNALIKTFPIGYDDTTKVNPYVPVEMLANGAYNVVSPVTGYMTVSPIAGTHPAKAPVGVALPYYWKVTSTGFSGIDYTKVNLRASTGNAIIPAEVNLPFYLTETSWQSSGTFTRGTSPAPSVIEYGSFPIPSQAELTAGNSVAFSAPRTLYSTGSGRFHDAIWSTLGHNGTDRTTPQPFDIVVIGGTATRNDSVSVRDSSVAVTVAKLIIRSSKLTVPNGSTPTFDMGPSTKYNLHSVSGGGKVIRTRLSEFGTYSELSGDWDGFMHNDTAQFEYAGGYQVLIYPDETDDDPLVNHGSYVLPSNFTVYPNLIIRGMSRESTTLPPVDITVRKNMYLIGWGSGIHPVLPSMGASGDVTVKGDLILQNQVALRFASYVQVNKVYTTTPPTNARARNFRVEGSIIMPAAAKDEPCSIETEDVAGNPIVHNLYVGKDIRIGNSSIICYRRYPTQALLDVTFTGTENSVVYQEPTVNVAAPYNLRFNRIIVNKTVTNASVFMHEEFDLHGNAAGNSSTKPLILTRGNLYIDHPLVSINLSTGGQPFNLPSTASLHVSNATVKTSGDNTGIWLDGLMEVGTNSQWLLNGGTNNYIEYSASGNAAILVQDGTLRVGSQIRRSLTSDAGILKFTQNKAASIISIGDNSIPGTANNRAMFEILNAGSSFVQTEPNSIITIGRAQNSTTVPDLLLSPETSAMPTGSTFILGNASTPAGTVFDVQSSVPLKNLTINSANSPTARLLILPLTIDENLTINSGSTFDANSLNLFLKGNFTNSGTYIPGTNTTYFIGSADQTVSGSTNFYNLTKQTTTNTLSFTGTSSVLTVNGNLTLLSGTLNLNSNTLQVKRNVNSIIPTLSSGSSQGILFNGTVNQVLSGGGTFSTLTINNSQGVLVPTEGESTTITNKLRLQNGVLDIGKNLLTLTASAQIEEVSPFSATNMIQTYISFTDAGIKKYFPAISTATSFTYPIGSQGKYTPILLDITSLTSSTGYIRVKSANERHITINDRPETAYDDRENVLAYYWTLDAGNIDGFTALATLDSYAGDIKTTAGNSAADYITARLLDASAGTLNKYSTDDFNEAVNELYFRFSNADDSGIDGDYFAGVDNAIPNNIPAYQTKQAGNWSDPSTWDTYPVTGGSIPDGGPRGNVVIINHPTTINTNYTTSYQTTIQSSGSLSTGTTIGNRLGNVSGQGRLILTTGNMPAGVYDNFFAPTGGTIEFAGTGTYDILSEINSVNNLVISGTGIRRLPNTALTINGDLTINTATLNNANNQIINIKKNIHMNGSFTSGSGRFVMNGTTRQTIDGTSSFSGTNNHYIFEVSNSAGININSNLDISRNLYLTNGIVYTTANSKINCTYNNTTAIQGYSNTNYIDGTISRYLPAATAYNTYILPVGNNGRYAPIELAGANYAGQWEAQFFNSNPSSNGMNSSSLQSSLGYVSNNEYWRIKAPSSATLANIKLTSDSQSLVYPEDANIRGALWTTISNNWSAVALQSTGGSSTAGYVTTSSVSFNNSTNGNYITFGYSTLPSYRWTGTVSTDWFNPGNWDYNQLPTAIISTIINQTANQPVVNGAAIAECNNLTINANGSLTINPGGKMTVNGNVVNNGQLILEHPYTNPSSFIIGGTNSGNTTIHQTLTSARNWYVGHPMNTNTHAYYTNVATMQVGYYNTAAKSWSAIMADNSLINTPMRGYLVYYGTSGGPYTATHSGQLYNGDQSYPLVTTLDTWNLLSNPYPTYIDLKNSSSTWDLSHVDPTIQIRSKMTGAYTFLSFNTATNVGSTGFENGLIAPMQAFWVQAKSAGNISVKTTARTHPSSTTSLKSSEVEPNDVLRLQLSNSSASDETIIVCRSIGSSTLTNIDSEKRMEAVGVLPQIFSIKDSKNIVINVMPEDPTAYAIPIGLTIGDKGAGNLTLTATNINNFLPDIDVYLRDLTTGTVINLHESPNYAFTTAAITNQKRFELFFRRASELTTGTEEDRIDNYVIEAYIINNKAVVSIIDSNFFGEAIISLYDSTGKLVRNAMTNQEKTEISLSEDAQMIIIKVVYKNQIKAFKILKPR